MPSPSDRLRSALRRGLVGGALGLAFGSTGSCRDAAPSPEPAPPSPAAPAPEIDVLWIGCYEIELPDDESEPSTCIKRIKAATPRPVRMHVWVPSAVSDPAFTIAGIPLPTEDGLEVDGGHHFVVNLPHSGRMRLVGTVDDRTTELLTLDIELRPHVVQPLKAQLDAAIGNLELQRELEARWREELAATTSLRQRLELTQYLQFVVYDQGRWRESAELALETAALARTLGRPKDACNSASSAAFLYGYQLGEIDEAERAFDAMCDYADSIPFAAMMDGYVHGLMQLQRGDTAQARRSIERGLDIARRLGWTQWERIVTNDLVEALSSQGRFGWARRLLEGSRELAPSDGKLNPLLACETEIRDHDRFGELAYREHRMLGQPPTEAREHWERALAIRCPEHESIRSVTAAVQTKLARIAFDEDRLDDAARRLDAIDTEVLTALDLRRHRLLRVELALAQGRLDAAERELAAIVAASKDDDRPQEQWRRFWLAARIHRARNRPGRAIESLLRAQQQLDRGIRSSVASVEADRSLAMRRDSGQLLVRLLLEQDLVEPALCAARMTRIRGLLGPTDPTAVPTPSSGELELRDRFSRYAWYDPRHIPMDERLAVEAALDELMSVAHSSVAKVRCEDLPPSAPGELSLLPFEDSDRWVVFAWTHGDVVRVHPLPPGPLPSDPAALGERLLDPFDDLLADSRRLRILAPPSLHEVSIPGLPWNGTPVGDAMTVAHALDLPPVPRASPRATTATLVFSDPRKHLLDDYPVLAGHFEDWATALTTRGFEVSSFAPTADDNPSLRSVLDRTQGTELALLYGFGATHPSRYARHPSADPSDPDRITFDLGATGLLRTDVLRQRGRVPRHVIMAHCDSATIDPHGISGAVGLAQSYVQAGSEWAVGTEGTVQPDTMLTAVDALLDAYVQDSSVDRVAKALRRLEHQFAAKGSPDAGKLRLWIP